MNYIFKLASTLLLITSLLASSFSGVFADLSGDDAFFIVTAYYSPLPGQVRYATGSYAGDIKLNGGGKTTASGMDVFEGLLAAPSGYDYGTKIHFKGYGVGQVEDRGGAIVRAGTRGFEHDRIDVWMGYGDEGLYRALNWGKKTIEGKVVDPSTEASLKLGKTFLGKYGGLTVSPDSPELDILKLQELFIDVDLYSGEIDGKYESIRDAIVDFQIQTGVIDSRDHDEAGYFGNKTRDSLREDFNFTQLIEEDVEIYTGAKAPPALTQEQKAITKYDGLEISPESGSEEIKRLQILFSEVGLYKGSIDGSYDSISGTLLNFQIGAGVVKDKDGWGAGYYGELTRKALFEYFKDDTGETIAEAPTVVNPPAEETVSTIVRTNQNTLSEQQVQELDELIVKLKAGVEQIADKKNQRSSDIFDELSERIDTLLDRDISATLKEKLKYIQKNI